MNIINNEEQEEIVNYKVIRQEIENRCILIDSIVCCQLNRYPLYIYRAVVFQLSDCTREVGLYNCCCMLAWWIVNSLITAGSITQLC
jgi:hypothetical protein